MTAIEPPSLVPNGPVLVRAARRRRRFDPLLFVVSIASLALLGLLLYLVWLSFHTAITGGDFTLRNYRSLFDDPATWPVIRNTMVFVGVTMVVAMAFGLPIAWLVERTDLRGRAGVYIVMSIGGLVPGFISAMGWTFLFHPAIGLVNTWFTQLTGYSRPIFDGTSYVGMGIAEGFALAPIVFVMCAGALRSMDTTLEEAAAASGAGLVSTLRRVTLPLAMPAIFGAALFTTMIAISAFDVPAVIGLPNRRFVFSTFMRFRMTTSSDDGTVAYGVVAAFGVLVMTFGLILGIAYLRMLKKSHRFQVVGGKSYKPRLVALGKSRKYAIAFIGWYFLWSRIVPLLVLVWAAVSPYLQIPSRDSLRRVSFDNFRNVPWDLVRRGMRNTALLMVAAPTVGLFVSFCFSWVILRSRYRHRHFYDYAAFLPQAVPPIVFGFAALLVALYGFKSFGPFDLYQSIWWLMIVYVLLTLSFSTRITNGALIQINRELEESAYMAGASTRATVKRIVLPLMRPAFLYAWLWLAMFSYRELTISQLLLDSGNTTLPSVIFGLFSSSEYGQASAVGVVMVLIMIPLVAFYLRVGGGAAFRQEPST